MSSLRTLFNDGFSFAEFPLETPYEDMAKSDKFKPVCVPHDWMISDVGSLYRDSIGFYRKSFNVEKENNHTYIIRFGCVYMDTVIYINGVSAFEWKYGYSAFDVDITSYINSGNNTIDVVSTYRSPNSRWYSGAGILRNVWFYDKDETYIVPDGVYLSGQKLSSGSFKLYADCELSTKDSFTGKVIHEIYDKEGAFVKKTETEVSFSGDYVSRSETVIDNAHLWDITDPYLYTVKTRLEADRVYDEESHRYGFRTVSIDPDKGFFLNERNIKINGVCQHHDLGALGAAFNETALRRQFLKLKDMGVNSVRTSHNMPAEELLDIADEMGILINSESFDMWEKTKTLYDYGNYFPDWWEKDTRSWVRQDRSHTCVIIWSIGNEIYDCHAGSGYKWNRLLRDAVRKYDYRHNAYIGSGSNYMEWEGAQKCADDLETAGYNYGERLYDKHHKAHPKRCIFGSETGSTVQSRGIYHFPLSKRLLTHEDGQCSSLGNCTTNWGAKSVDAVISDHRDRDFVFGQFIWTGWDYIGEPTPYFTKNSYFGQIDTAGFEKDTFYHYKAEWTDHKISPMVHVLPYWDFNEGQLIDVCVYSNAPAVGLYLNDSFLGKKTIDHAHSNILFASWQINYVPGTLKAEAYDEDGNVIATDIQTSFKDSKSLVLKADKETLKADTKDLIFVEISAVDEDGHPVMNARNRINVTVSGAGILVGLDNGDSSDYEQYKGTSRKLFSGKLLAIIASNGKTGTIDILAESDGLSSAKLTLNAEEAIVQKGSVFMEENQRSEEKHDIPIRRINLINKGTNRFDKSNIKTDVELKVLPENATFNDISVKALTIDGVEANFAKVVLEGNTAHVTALGDGSFRLTAVAKNGSGLSEIISELEFEAAGLGAAALDPYKTIPGINFSECSSKDAELSFMGGVFIPDIGKSFVTYENVDFGPFGSDKIVIPIFSFDDELSLSVWEGGKKSKDCLGRFTYRAKSIYNHYQENVFTLSRRIKGTKSVTIKFDSNGRFSFKGFSFERLNKAYETVNATENLRITGDSFTVSKDAVTNIGNNVSIEFDDMNFDEGMSSVIICGRSHKEITSVHLVFEDESSNIRQMVEIPFSKEYKEFNLPLQDLRINGKVSLVFLPGSDFDLKWFKFIRK